MITILKDFEYNECHLSIVNVHLQGHPDEHATRTRQLQKALASIQRLTLNEEMKIVIAGVHSLDLMDHSED